LKRSPADPPAGINVEAAARQDGKRSVALYEFLGGPEVVSG